MLDKMLCIIWVSEHECEISTAYANYLKHFGMGGSRIEKSDN